MVIQSRQYKIKIFIDKLNAFILFLLLSPLTLTITILIKLTSKGPVIYKQKRLGYNGHIFEIYKFRSMKLHNDDLRNPDGTTYNSEHDPRLTDLGKFLRKMSIDEFPQLINILKGEMSFVGPRPDLPEFYNIYTNDQKQKLNVLPGITGLAQINGRNEIPLKKRWEYDVTYYKEFSLLLDLKISIKTIQNVLFSKGIYSVNPKK